MSSTASSRTIRLSDDLCYSRANLYKEYRQCPVYPNNIQSPMIYFAQYSSRKDIDSRKKSSALTRAFNWYTQERGPSVSSAYYDDRRTRPQDSEMRDFSEWLDRKFAEYHREKMVSTTNSPASFYQSEQRRSSRDQPRNGGANAIFKGRNEDLEYIMKPKQIHCNRSTLHPPDQTSCSTEIVAGKAVCKPILKSRSCVTTCMCTKQSNLLNSKPSQPPSSDERQLNVVSMDMMKCNTAVCTDNCCMTEEQKRYIDAQCQNSMGKVGLQDAQVQYERMRRKSDGNDRNRTPYKKKVEELWVLPKNKFQAENGSDDYVKDCSCCTNYYTNNLTLMKQRGYKTKENNSEMQTSNHEVDLKDMCNGPFMIRFLQVQEERMRR